ncbi:MAG: ribosome recycling factor [Hyphomonadaceae bacterium]|nr:MAG: ribosome recycling factor [Caulobacteraceae bacterium]MBT9445062.1 ribosome recycling factor [Hyphomonadaceae bacterium]TPW08931.1 MAG: ribosome recycling factor [Alphaproteobacteria bacterium]
MPNTPFNLDDIKKRMDGALAALKTEYTGLRTGRANIHLLDPIHVDAYGASTPLNQVGAVSAPEPRMLAVQVWDKGVVNAVEKAIRNAGLGVNPIVDGQTIRVPIPPLNEERRRELAKLAGKYAEAARVAVRNVRRDGMEHLKRLEKDGDISQDQHKKFSEQVQQATDQFVKSVDQTLASKEEEIMQV